MRLIARALQEQQAGSLPQAADAYRAAIALAPKSPDIRNSLGLVLDALGRRDDAIAAFQQAIVLKPAFHEAMFNLGLAFANAQRPDDAVKAFDRALALKPDFAETHYNLGNAFLALDREEVAIAAYRRAIALRPDHASAYNNLGVALRQRGDSQEAADAFRRLVALRPDSADAINNLAFALHALGQVDEAVAHYRRVLALQPAHVNARINLGNLLNEQGRLEEAEACYRRAIEIRPDLAAVHFDLGMMLQRQGRTAEASECYRRVLAIDPHHGPSKFALCIAHLPIIAASEAELARRREDYAAALAALSTDATAPDTRRGLAEGVGAAQPFFLAYQGRNDRALQQRYGALVCDLVGERHPPAPMPPPPGPGEPIRVGIVSGYFYNHSNWKIPIKGWLSQLDRSRFALYGYYLGQTHDDATRMAESLCRKFVQGPLPLERWRETVIADQPHVLIYPEIGMHPVAPLLAAQRLAPVQCNSWGHPDTSGFPTLDYYLSSDLMEPANADAHYTEKLVRLPNLSIHYEPVEVVPARIDRAELGLRPDATVYWCCQSLYKYLPRYDDVFPRIARLAGDCQFVFLETIHGPLVARLFRERIAQAFAAHGRDAARFCVFLPSLSQERFHGAMACCDVFLDSIGWSGCNSTLESLERDLPIVTMRGDLMRGRHTAAILEMMGLAGSVADDVDAYVARAVRMAREPLWRAELRGEIAARKQRVWRDRACITALEGFLEEAVRRHASAPPQAITAGTS